MHPSQQLEAEATEECSLLILYLLVPRWLSYGAQAHLPRDGAAYNRLCPSTSIVSHQSLTDKGTGQSDQGNSSIETPSNNFGLCQVDS